jgi:hypothetical protein
VKNDTKGLGSKSQQPQITISLKDKRKQDIMAKTRQRFDQV